MYLFVYDHVHYIYVYIYLQVSFQQASSMITEENLRIMPLESLGVRVTLLPKGCDFSLVKPIHNPYELHFTWVLEVFDMFHVSSFF